MIKQKKTLQKSLTDPDENFFNNNNFKSINTPYLLPDEARNFIHTFEKNSFSALHINIRSLSKNFKNVKHLLSTLIVNSKLFASHLHHIFEFQITQ